MGIRWIDDGLDDARIVDLFELEPMPDDAPD
jgi:hypothetical protein